MEVLFDTGKGRVFYRKIIKRMVNYLLKPEDQRVLIHALALITLTNNFLFLKGAKMS